MSQTFCDSLGVTHDTLIWSWRFPRVHIFSITTWIFSQDPVDTIVTSSVVGGTVVSKINNLERDFYSRFLHQIFGVKKVFKKCWCKKMSSKFLGTPDFGRNRTSDFWI